jgi:hypothetical protein
MKKIIRSLTLVLLITACAAFLFACNTDADYIDLTEVYKNAGDKSYFTAKQYVKLPANVQVMTLSMTGDAANSQLTEYNYYLYRTNQTGYIDFADGFVLTKAEGSAKIGRYYGFYKAEANDVTVEVKYEKIYFKYNLIVAQDSDNLITVFDTDGNIKLQQVKDAPNGFFNPSSSSYYTNSAYSLDKYVSVLSPKYVGYTRDSVTHVFSVASGAEVVSLRNVEIANIRIYDDYMFVKSTVNSKDNVSFVKLSDSERVTSIPKSGNGWFEEFTSTATDKLVVSYLGGARFFILRQTNGADDNYTYIDQNDAKFIAEMWFYDAEKDSRTRYNGNIIPTTGIFTLADAADIEIDLKGFLKNPAYGYVGSAFVVNNDKTAYFDQLIVDRDLNVAASLTNTIGYAGDEKSDSVRDLALVYNNGYGVPGHMFSEGDIRVYDRYGNVVKTFSEHKFFSAKVSRDFVIAGVRFYDENGKKTALKYGMYDMTGNAVLPCEYDEITEFSGNYALAIKITPAHKDANGVDVEASYDYTLVDFKGNKISANADTWGNIAGSDNSIAGNIAWTSGGTGKPIYFGGVYVYKITDGEENYYSIRNFNPDSDSSGLLFSTGIPEEAEHKTFRSVTLIRSNLSLTGDLSAQYPEKLFAATQNESGGQWTLWTLTAGTASGVAPVPVFAGTAPSASFFNDLEFTQIEIIIMAIIVAVIGILLLVLVILILAQRKRTAARKAAVKAERDLAGGFNAAVPAAGAAYATDGGEKSEMSAAVYGKEKKKKAKSATGAEKRAEIKKEKEERKTAEKERYAKARERKLAEEKAKAAATDAERSEEVLRRERIRQEEQKADMEKRAGKKAEKEKKYSAKKMKGTDNFETEESVPTESVAFAESLNPADETVRIAAPGKEAPEIVSAEKDDYSVEEVISVKGDTLSGETLTEAPFAVKEEVTVKKVIAANQETFAEKTAEINSVIQEKAPAAYIDVTEKETFAEKFHEEENVTEKEKTPVAYDAVTVEEKSAEEVIITDEENLIEEVVAKEETPVAYDAVTVKETSAEEASAKENVIATEEETPFANTAAAEEKTPAGESSAREYTTAPTEKTTVTDIAAAEEEVGEQVVITDKENIGEEVIAKEEENPAEDIAEYIPAPIYAEQVFVWENIPEVDDGSPDNGFVWVEYVPDFPDIESSEEEVYIPEFSGEQDDLADIGADIASYANYEVSSEDISDANNPKSYQAGYIYVKTRNGKYGQFVDPNSPSLRIDEKGEYYLIDTASSSVTPVESKSAVAPVINKPVTVSANKQITTSSVNKTAAAPVAPVASKSAAAPVSPVASKSAAAPASPAASKSAATPASPVASKSAATPASPAASKSAAALVTNKTDTVPAASAPIPVHAANNSALGSIAPVTNTPVKASVASKPITASSASVAAKSAAPTAGKIAASSPLTPFKDSIKITPAAVVRTNIATGNTEVNASETKELSRVNKHAEKGMVVEKPAVTSVRIPGEKGMTTQTVIPADMLTSRSHVKKADAQKGLPAGTRLRVSAAPLGERFVGIDPGPHKYICEFCGTINNEEDEDCVTCGKNRVQMALLIVRRKMMR